MSLLDSWFRSPSRSGYCGGFAVASIRRLDNVRDDLGCHDRYGDTMINIDELQVGYHFGHGRMVLPQSGHSRLRGAKPRFFCGGAGEMRRAALRYPAGRTSAGAEGMRWRPHHQPTYALLGLAQIATAG
jgi:hypothetical protein